MFLFGSYGLITPGQVWKYRSEEGISANINNRFVIIEKDSKEEWRAKGNVLNTNHSRGLWWVGSSDRIYKEMIYLGMDAIPVNNTTVKYQTKTKCKHCHSPGAFHSYSGFEDECLNTSCKYYSIKWVKDTGLPV